MGFIYEGEKPGRGKDQVPLDFYWYQHHRSLFDVANESKLQSRAKQAVVDANVFFNMKDNSEHPLLADWLAEDMVLCVTPELLNEIQRNKNSQARRESLSYAETFPRVSSDNVDQIEKLLRSRFPYVNRLQDKSDIRQLAHAVAAEVEFFVTNDRKFASNVAGNVFDEFGIRVVSPDDLITHLDELMNAVAYQPQRLAGSRIEIRRTRSGQADLLAATFQSVGDEKKSGLTSALKHYLSYPSDHEVQVIQAASGEYLALVVVSYKNDRLQVPLIRVVKGIALPALETQLVSKIVRLSIQKGYSLVEVSERHLSDSIVRALKENSFSQVEHNWLKFSVRGILSAEDTGNKLRQLAVEFENYSEFVSHIETGLKDAFLQSNISELIQTERLLWPIKIEDANIPSYVVPIRPEWAIHLFDTNLGSQTLFGSDPNLVFSMDNVYYRSSRPKMPTENSRVLWYVSQGSNRNVAGVKAIRACSYVDEVVVGSPKQLFKQFKELGVYRWNDVYETAHFDIDREVLAFRFSRTELLDTSISLPRLREIFNRASAFMSPTKISSRDFMTVYREGMNRHE